jgi:hypothetical protein
MESETERPKEGCASLKEMISNLSSISRAKRAKNYISFTINLGVRVSEG